MSSAPTLNEYCDARAIVKESEFWAHTTNLVGILVSLAVLIAGIIIDDGSIMASSCGVMVAFCVVSTGILLSARKHQRVLSRF